MHIHRIGYAFGGLDQAGTGAGPETPGNFGARSGQDALHRRVAGAAELLAGIALAEVRSDDHIGLERGKALRLGGEPALAVGQQVFAPGQSHGGVGIGARARRAAGGGEIEKIRRGFAPFCAALEFGAAGGEIIKARAEVVRRTGQMVFMRGDIYTDERVILTCSSVLRRMRKS